MTAPTTSSYTEAVAASGVPRRMSYEEYLALDAEGIAEWVDGEVTISVATRVHQRVVRFLLVVLDMYVRAMKLGMVNVAPLPMRARPGGSGREPDIFFVTTEHLDRLTEQQLVGPADLAVEVISDDSVGRDRAEKFYEYEEAGVSEYWIIDPRGGRLRADFYVLDEAGKYRPIPIPASGIYASTVIRGLSLRVDRLWQTDPDPYAALAETLPMEKLIAAFQAGGAAR